MTDRENDASIRALMSGQSVSECVCRVINLLDSQEIMMSNLLTRSVSLSNSHKINFSKLARGSRRTGRSSY